MFRNINGPWGQDGNYLVRQNDRFGKSVSIDATGTIACIGGDWFNNNAGSTWVYKWNNGVWAYTNVVLFGSGAVGPARQGEFVKMTNNAKYLFVGGPADNSSKGAIWHFADTSCTPRLIQQADTLVCKSSNITLSIDPSVYNSSACTNAQLNTGVRNGLVGYWPFCGNANDESGNANNGTVFGATLTSDRFGRPNSAYSFNGQNANYIKSPGSTLFTSNNMTLSYWVNITTYNELSEIICLGNSSGTYWGASASNRIVALNYGSGCGTGMTTYPTYTFTPNSWFNVTIVADRINRINKIYINGQFIGNNPSGTLSGCSTADLYFGVDIFGLPEYFTGKLDDICIWNRALTTAEIQQISNNNLQNISVLWSTGSSANSINVSPQQTTTYYVTVNIGGATYTDSIRVQVSTVDTSVVNLDPTSICLTGGQVRLQAGLASSYLWLRENMPIPGATNQLYTALQTGSYRVVMSNSLGCIDTSRAILVTVNPQPIPSFTVNRSSQCKNGNSFIFTNNSTISSGTLSYAWSFGDGNTSTALSPTYSYTAAGTYAVKLVVTSNNGCRDSITQTVSVLPSPMPGFTVNNLTQCLSGNSFVFTNTSTITPGTLSYSWNFGNGTTSTATNPTFSYAAAGTYTVTLIATSNSGCIDSIRQNVVVNSNASGSISTPTSTIICEGGSVTLSANGGTTYQWALNGANIPGATNPTYSASLPGVYSVQINNASGCSGTSSNTITLSLVRRPTADFTSTGSCASFPVTFTNQSTVSNSGIVTYSWTFGNGSTSTNVNPTAVYSSPGNYNVTLIVTPQACPALSSSITKPITVINATPNQRYTSLNAVVNRNLQLQARTFTGAIYQWIPPTGLNNATIVNPIFNSNRQQEYLIKIATPDGCVVTDTLLVRIFDGRGIYLPKGFTPNGDGNNDKLTPRLVGISRLIFFKVYDRWGQLMYQTSIAGEGWDGTFKGVKQPIETYTWVAEGVDIDGNTIRETGNSMLLR